MLIFGIDAGIASIGWAVLTIDDNTAKIIACGTRMFDAPETDKERKPTNAIRREKRGMRRVFRRRRQRMNAIRKLLAESSLLPNADKSALALNLNPWPLRQQALDRRLTNPEFATILGHIARHRGFRSNAKSDRSANAADETSKMLKAIATTRDRLGQYRTIGEMFATDPAFTTTKRNRGGGFSHSILRDDQEAEIRKIFSTQRRLGNQVATESLEATFIEIAFSQRPLQDSDHLVGACPFIPTERRAARRAYSFELFRLLAKLNTITIETPAAPDRRLSRDEIANVANDFGAQKTITWKSLRKTLALPPTSRFAGIGPDDEKHDIVARTGAAAEGTYAIRQCLGDAGWKSLLTQPATLDHLAAILSFRADLTSITQAIASLPFEPILIETLCDAVHNGKFNNFSRAGHISATAARALIPHLATGLVYSEACSAAGFDHAARPEISLDDVRNPVARKAVTEIIKQVKVIAHEFGHPDRIHLELARDVGKSADERDEITRGIEKRNRERDKNRNELQELLHRDHVSPDDMLRYELWKEQNGRCLYTDREISPPDLLATANAVQIDHILPWSRFGDDSFNNKTLCLTSANADKRGRTPFEWFSADKTPHDWELFQARVESCKSMKNFKKRGHYLRRNAAEIEERFRARNLGDTRYATRLALDLLARKFYPGAQTRHVLARPGALTAKLRQGWGLESLKKSSDGQRQNDDRHHALDAIVVAACTESMLNRLTRAFQEAERRGLGRDFRALDQPWDGFRTDVQTAFAAITVSRAERHRARGEAHAATIKQVRERNGKPIVFDRKPVDKLTLADLANVKDPERNAAIIESLRAWIEQGKPKNSPPLSPKGDPISKIRLATKDKPAVLVRAGTADRGDMARIDVFVKPDAKNRPRFYLIPIYPHQIATLAAPPNQAVDNGKDEPDWTTIDASFHFKFSIYSNSLLEITKPDGEIICGYFKGLNRSVAAITLAEHQNPLAVKQGIGTRTLLSFRKFNIDRLGRIAEIKQETRTWHGVACT
ncbi:MAG: type II CRISPR RNA-guided endonuclease Cas9 [Acidiphilium sp. 21-60-14]|nr:MAG: type II CRISPR RNA-guided endonuclease Cas9 [Acidiphilium sp. 21-60-14]OYW12653.1 MAG: type II CRISPR RNA-guided endonuclease Cas9 [Acidiphilium sp. 37-67-22]